MCCDHIGVDLKITAAAATSVGTWPAIGVTPRNPNGVWTYDDPRRPCYLFDLNRPSPVQLPKQIHYWGHYPVADLEYETDAPVQLGLRAWTPFLPGDLKDSTIPGIVFEAHLRNVTAEPQTGTLVMNFPGPTANEAGAVHFQRDETSGDFHGMEVRRRRQAMPWGLWAKKNSALAGTSATVTRRGPASLNRCPSPGPAEQARARRSTSRFPPGRRRWSASSSPGAPPIGKQEAHPRPRKPVRLPTCTPSIIPAPWEPPDCWP